MIRLVMFVLFAALILTGGSAVVARGWQVTHASQPGAKIAKAKPAEIVASMIAWTTSAPDAALPGIVKDVNETAPWLPETSISDVRGAVSGAFKTLADLTGNETVGAATSWVKNSVETTASSLGLGSGSALVAQAPAPAPTKTTVAPAPVVVAQAPVVKVAPPAPAPVIAPVPVPVPAPAAPAPVAKVAPLAPAAPAPVAKPAQSQAQVPAQVEVVNGSFLTVTEKGCAVGGIAGTGASLLIGPAEIAAWATGAAAVLPATARVVGTVIGAALAAGCAAGALVAPAVAK